MSYELIDIVVESEKLAESIRSTLGVAQLVYDIDEICTLSIQDNVMRVIYSVEEIYVTEPLVIFKSLMTTDCYEKALYDSRELAELIIDRVTTVNKSSDITWLSKTIGVVS